MEDLNPENSKQTPHDTHTGQPTQESDADLSNPVTITGNTITERSMSLLTTHLYSDLRLRTLTQSGVTKDIHVHRCMMARVSPEWGSAVRWAAGGILQTTPFSYEIMWVLVMYIYTGRCNFDDLGDCYDIIAACDYYNMADMIGHCCVYVRNMIIADVASKRELMQFFNQATLLKINPIIEICIAYFEENPTSLFASSEFLELTQDSIRALLKTDTFVDSEFTLIYAVCRWARNSSAGAADIGAYLNQLHLKSLFKWKVLEMPEFLELEKEYRTLFTKEEFLNILQYFSSIPSTLVLPCEGRKKRGGENENTPSRVYVRSPPYEILEEFIFYGRELYKSVNTLALDMRVNTLDIKFAGLHEERMLVKCFGQTMRIVETVEYGQTVTARLPQPVQLHHIPNGLFNVSITFLRPGVYEKNGEFTDYDQLVMRMKRGIVSMIYDDQRVVEQNMETNSSPPS